MAAPVWVLSVDLQTRTATFETGLADAAKSARGSFQDIKASATEMGDGVAEASGRTEYSMMGARHSVIMLGEEFGVHLPRGISTFIASLGPVGAALEIAFPFIAIILGATLLIEHLSKLHDEANKLADSQAGMAETIQSTFNKLDDKLLAVGIRADELSGDHLDKLRKQLELIDHQELKNLIEEFGTLDKVSVAVLNQLKAHWYEMGSGSTGAVHALDEFKRKYEGLLAQGKSKDAGDLLAGTLASAEKVLALQKQAVDNQGHSGGQHGDYTKYEQASVQLKQIGVGFTQKEVEAQQTLTDALRAQVTVAEKLGAIGKGEKHNEATAESQRSARELSEAQVKLKEATDRLAEAREKLKRTESSAMFESEKQMDKEIAAGLAQVQARILDYIAALKERARVTEELGKEEAEHIRKMAALGLHEEEEQTKESVKLHKRRSDEILAEQIAGENANYAALLHADQIQLATLDHYGKDYEVKIKQINDHEAELTKAHENKITDIKAKAEEERNATILAAEQKFGNEMSSGMMKVLKGQESFSHMMVGLGQEVASGMLQSLMTMETVEGRKKLSAARLAGAEGFQWGMEHGGVTAPVLAPIMAAVAFAGVMAFEEGGIVPGVEKGDVVPARLTPGEGVIPEKVMTGISNAAKHGGGSGGSGDTHVHYHNHSSIQAFDSDGVDKVLQQHGDKFISHVGNELRKRNL